MSKLDRAIQSVTQVVDSFDPSRGTTPNIVVTIADLRLVLAAAKRSVEYRRLLDIAQRGLAAKRRLDRRPARKGRK